MAPMSPQQAAYLRQMNLEQQRALNEQQLQIDRALLNRQPLNLQTGAQPQGQGVTAIWTGRSQPAQSITGMAGFNCEYNFAGRVFWRMFAGPCPTSVQAQ